MTVNTSLYQSWNGQDKDPRQAEHWLIANLGGVMMNSDLQKRYLKS